MIAIKRDATFINDEGSIGGQDAGATLVRRLLRIFPGASIIGEDERHCKGFDVVSAESLDPENTVVINMDIIDSMGLWNTLYYASGGKKPHIMNFVWWPLSSLTEQVQISSAALSCALFPSFANSERTASEVRNLTQKWTVHTLSSQIQLAWVNLGYRLSHAKERQKTEIPVVLYPAIYLSDRKAPGDFIDIVTRVHEHTPIAVAMRLTENDLYSDMAEKISCNSWVHVEALTQNRPAYWDALSRTTAFLATAKDESYGLSYVEAMGAGVIGIFPDRDWVRVLVPDGYPFIYSTPQQAVDLLEAAVKHTAECRKLLDELVGEPFTTWIGKRHNDDVFSREIARLISFWFDV